MQQPKKGVHYQRGRQAIHLQNNSRLIPRHNGSVHGALAYCSPMHRLVQAWLKSWLDPCMALQWRLTAQRADLAIAAKLAIPESLYRHLLNPSRNGRPSDPRGPLRPQGDWPEPPPPPPSPENPGDEPLLAWCATCRSWNSGPWDQCIQRPGGGVNHWGLAPNAGNEPVSPRDATLPPTVPWQIRPR